MIIKILFSAIIFSFCLWGIGDIIRNYSASKTVLSVNRTKFSVESFLREYTQEKNRIRNIGSKPLSEKEMKKLHVDQLVLDKMINDAVLEQAFNKFNIIIPKKTIAAVIHSMPQFQDHGTFNSRLYETAMRRSGISEAGFLAQIRDNLARTQLLQPLVSGYKIPEMIKDILEKDFVNQKTVLLAKMKVSDVKLDKKLTEADYKDFYESNSEKYKVKETRNCSIFVGDFTKLAESLDVSQEEVDKYFEENKSLYEPKETRNFERFAFETKEDADKAWNMINRGTSTQEIIKNFTPDMEEIENQDKSDFPKEIGDVLFGLKESKSSPVYAIGDKFYIYKVSKINRAKARSEKDIKAEIAKELKEERMNTPEFCAKVKEMKDKIDDGFGSGKSVETMVKETGMKQVDLTDLQKDSDAKLAEIASDEETRHELMEAIFSTDENQASQIIDSRASDTLSFVVFTRKVVPAQIPAYEKIKETVKDDCINEMKNEVAISQIDGIMKNSEGAAKEVSKMKGSKKFKISKKDIMTFEKTHSAEVKRILEDIPNPNVMMNILSAIKVGEATYFKATEGEYYVVAIEDMSQTQTADAEFSKALSNYIDSASANDIIPLSMNAFKKDTKIKIEHKLIEEITKTNDEEEQNY